MEYRVIVREIGGNVTTYTSKTVRVARIDFDCWRTWQRARTVSLWRVTGNGRKLLERVG